MNRKNRQENSHRYSCRYVLETVCVVVRAAGGTRIRHLQDKSIGDACVRTNQRINVSGMASQAAGCKTNDT